jgi:hypothetical protein
VDSVEKLVVNLLCSVFETEAFWVVVEKMDTADKWDSALLSDVVVVVAAVDCWLSWNEEDDEEVGPSICLLL